MKNKWKIYWNYFKYIVEHRRNVRKVCFKMGLYWQGLIHDLSKYSPAEFKAYAIKFFGGDYAYKYFEVESEFEKAWLHHQHKNPHHWQYWVQLKTYKDKTANYEAHEIPFKYTKEMICDWIAMGIKFNDTAIEYYNKNKDKMILHETTRKRVEGLLGEYYRK